MTTRTKEANRLELTHDNGLLKISPEDAAATFVVSQEGEPDRDGDLVVIDGIDLTDFAKNSVWCWAHNSTTDRPPIGTARHPRTGELAVWKTAGRLVATCFFDTADPFAMSLFRKVQSGHLRACSIAFVPIEAEPLRAGHKAYTRDAERSGYLFRRVSLTEISLVGIGSNADALVVCTGRDCWQPGVQVKGPPRRATRRDVARAWKDLEADLYSQVLQERMAELEELVHERFA